MKEPTAGPTAAPKPAPVPLPDWTGTGTVTGAGVTGTTVQTETGQFVDPRTGAVRERVVVVDGLHAKQHPPTPFDPWQTDDGDNYNRGHFYVKAVPKKRQGGAPKNVQVPLNPDQHAVISQIVQQRMVPAYQTMQDLIRDAITHRLHDLTHGAEGMPIYIDDPYVTRLAELEQITARAETARQATMAERAGIETLRAGFDTAVEIGHRAEIHRLLEEAARMADTVKGTVSRTEIRELIAVNRERVTAMDRGETPNRHYGYGGTR